LIRSSKTDAELKENVMYFTGHEHYFHLSQVVHAVKSIPLWRLMPMLVIAAVVVMKPQFLEGQIRTETIAETGDLSPDGNGVFGSFTLNVFINQSGNVLFESNLTGTSGGTADNFGIFREFEGTISEIVREGDAAPDGNGIFQTFLSPHVDDSGSVVFRGNLTGTSGGSTDTTGIFEGSGASVTTVVRAGQLVPEGNGVFAGFTAPSPNSNSRMTFRSNLSGTSGGAADNAGIYLASNGNPTNIARKGQTVPGGNGTFDNFSASLINCLGQISFSAELLNTVGGNADNKAIFRSTDENIVEIARKGMLAPDNNGTLQSFPQMFFPINDLGEIAFEAGLTGTIGGSTDNNGMFRGSGGELTQIARAGQSSPDGNGIISSMGFAIRLNQAGEVIFLGNLSGTSGGGSDNSALYVGDGSELIQIVREGDLVPDSNGTVSLFLNDIYMNDFGVALFNPLLLGTAGGFADDSAILMGDGIETIQVVRKGQMLDGSTVVAVGYINSQTGTAINNFGQAVYMASLADGRSLVQRVTPDLHWRAGSSEWDISDNWTLGISPGEVHDVLIDPVSNITVLGPSANVAIRSLRVGGDEGDATLQLQGAELATDIEVCVAAESTLTGVGQINSVVEIEGILSPGNSIGTISVQGILKLRESSILEIDITGTSVNEFDQVVVLGDFSVLGELSVEFEDLMLAPFQEFPIVEISGDTDGAFTGLNDGDVVAQQNGVNLYITYMGGDGNDIVLFTTLLGDVNLDGNVNLLDVAPFVALLSQGGYQPEADINQDGIVNLLDVAGFVELLSNP
jgi:hypothetical protein